MAGVAAEGTSYGGNGAEIAFSDAVQRARLSHADSITLGELLVVLPVYFGLIRHGLCEVRTVDHLVTVSGPDGERVGPGVGGNDHGGAIVRNPLKSWACLAGTG